jgi:hypothetical protein
MKKLKKFEKESKYFAIISNDSNKIEHDSIKTIALLELYQNKNVFKIETELFQKKYGNYFFFRTNGKLLDYKYLCNEFHFTYGIEYNVLENRYIEVGAPYLDYMEYNSLTERKIFFNFSTFPRKKLDVSISKDSIRFNKVELKESTFMPFVEVYEYKTTKNDSVVYFKITASKPIVELENLPSTITEIIKVEF